ncbi:MAG: hypothetical protein ACYC7D_05420 [Nitrososphaerales archaeon]
MTGYVFQTQSDVAAVLPGGSLTNGTPMVANLTVNSEYGTNMQSQVLSPGIYTVVGGDEWGQIVILHFSILQSLTDPIQVVSVVGPIPPYNPGGPVPLVVGLVSMAFGIYLMVRRKPIFQDREEAVHQPGINTKKSNSESKLGDQYLPAESIAKCRDEFPALFRSFKKVLRLCYTLVTCDVYRDQAQIAEDIEVFPKGIPIRPAV